MEKKYIEEIDESVKAMYIESLRLTNQSEYRELLPAMSCPEIRVCNRTGRATELTEA